MRRLVNAYAAHLARLLDDGDSFDTFVGLTEVGGIMLALIAAVTAAVFLAAAALDSGHGSCKVQHRVGKSYVCDEYYPPVVTEP